MSHLFLYFLLYTLRTTQKLYCSAFLSAWGTLNRHSRILPLNKLSQGSSKHFKLRHFTMNVTLDSPTCSIQCDSSECYLSSTQEHFHSVASPIHLVYCRQYDFTYCAVSHWRPISMAGTSHNNKRGPLSSMLSLSFIGRVLANDHSDESSAMMTCHEGNCSLLGNSVWDCVIYSWRWVSRHSHIGTVNSQHKWSKINHNWLFTKPHPWTMIVQS